MKTLNLYRDKAGQYRWRLIASNGEILANGAGDGYKRRRSLDRALCLVFDWMQTKDTTIGQLMTWNRGHDMKLTDETGPLKCPARSPLAKVKVAKPAPLPKAVKPAKKPKRVRSRTPAQKAARKKWDAAQRKKGRKR